MAGASGGVGHGERDGGHGGKHERHVGRFARGQDGEGERIGLRRGKRGDLGRDDDLGAGAGALAQEHVGVAADDLNAWAQGGDACHEALFRRLDQLGGDRGRGAELLGELGFDEDDQGHDEHGEQGDAGCSDANDGDPATGPGTDEGLLGVDALEDGRGEVGGLDGFTQGLSDLRDVVEPRPPLPLAHRQTS
jgi:hypothetical protein